MFIKLTSCKYTAKKGEDPKQVVFINAEKIVSIKPIVSDFRGTMFYSHILMDNEAWYTVEENADQVQSLIARKRGEL